MNVPLTVDANVTGWALGYTVLNVNRTVYAAFSTTGMAEVGSTGEYAVSGGVTMPDAGGYIQVLHAPAGTVLVVEISVAPYSVTATGSYWGGTAIPSPTRYERSEDVVGSQYLVADGSMATDYVTAKTIISLEFADITSAERDTLEAKFATFVSAALIVANETSENVIPIINSLRTSRLAGGTRAYTVSGQVRTL